MSSAEESRLPRGGGAGQLLLSQSSQDRPHQLPLGVGQLATMARYLQFLTEGPVLQLRKGDSQSHRLLRKTLSRICQGFQGRDCVALQRLISTREGAKTYQALQGGEHRAVPRHFPQVLKDGATGLLVQQRERTQLQVGTFCRRHKNNDRSHQRRRESRESVGSVSDSDSNHLSGSFS